MGRVMAIVSMPAMLAPILARSSAAAILQNLHWFMDLPRQPADRRIAPGAGLADAAAHGLG